MRDNNTIAALRYLLMQYDNDRKHLYGEVNTMLNTSDSFTMESVVEYVDARVERIARIEQKYSTALNLMTQAIAQLGGEQQSSQEES